MPITKEEDLETICVNCGKEHDNNFTSVWDNITIAAHYKIKDCEHCGYEISFRTTDGSGVE